MYLILKSNFDVNNISLINKNPFNYNIIYNLNYVIILGISITIPVFKVKKYNNLFFLYINNLDIIKKLLEIEEYINSIINNFILLRGNNKEYFIIIKNYKGDYNICNVNISINKIILQGNKYIPIINII